MIGAFAALAVNANVMLGRYDGRAALGACLVGQPTAPRMQKV